MNPKHIDIVPNDRRAIAPYNFVELPATVVAAEDLPSGDRYHLDRKTGKIECTLTTESPLYIRCGLTTEEFKAEKEGKDLPDFFYTDPNAKNEKPVLPGSSLRGMLRTLVEIVSFGKIDRVSGNQRLFFRAVAANKNKESWGEEYKKYVEAGKIKAGYLKKDSEGWYIQPAKNEQCATFAWVRETTLNLPDFKKFNHDKYEPQYISASYRSESVAVDQTDKAKRLFANDIELPDTHPQKGVLVTSGNMKQGDESSSSPRHNHCLVFAEDKNARPLKIDKTAIEHYRNALTDFQKKSPFNKNLGLLEENQNRPVFYYHDQNSNTVGFFGQSPNFRIPYSPKGNGHATTVLDFIPEDLRKLASIDLADAIFGWVKKESKDEKLSQGFDKQRAGRVFFTDALYQSSQNGIWYEDNPVTPQILSNPKPTNFPHYLVQQNVDKLELKHYASEPIEKTVIRGHKLYWHKGSNPDFKLPPPKKVIDLPKKILNTQTTLISDPQTTQISPIKKGVTFKFDIHFENLSKVELGALLWVLSLSSDKSQTLDTGKQDEKYCFSLGMGKPLGMGAVNIDYELHLSNRKERYKHLFNGTKWKTGEEDQSQTPEKEEESVKAFEKYILDWICCQDYPKDRKREQLQHLKQLPRIEMLLAMLRCNSPNAKQTRYMTIEPDNEYKDRRVLPTPLDVMGIPDNRRCYGTSSNSNSNLQKPIIKKSSPPVSNQKTHSNSPKPEPKQKTDRDEGGSGVNLATQRPSKPPKR
ncbi:MULTISPECIES: TIGR03986 family type III CRISPR-associated RAMP protein [unclassified Microcoleus]|uniref:TIGR03986 family type III CRISPR-associated RAMP protein n=1 Tax=unclassified Microcoleus TaxID=2642155 RepID=UPI002FD62046